jgi:putative Ca2+/H+ antiporter (TMEM165/GDT1 family)
MKIVIIVFFILQELISCQQSSEFVNQNYYLSFTYSSTTTILTEICTRSFFLILIYSTTNNLGKTITLSILPLITTNLICITLGSILSYYFRIITTWLSIAALVILIALYTHHIIFNKKTQIEKEFKNIQTIVRRRSTCYVANEPDYKDPLLNPFILSDEINEINQQDINKDINNYIDNEDSKSENNSDEIAVKPTQESQRLIENDDDYDGLRAKGGHVNSFKNYEERVAFPSGMDYVKSLLLVNLYNKTQIVGFIFGANGDYFGVIFGSIVGILIVVMLAVFKGDKLLDTISSKLVNILLFTLLLSYTFILCLDVFIIAD